MVCHQFDFEAVRVLPIGDVMVGSAGMWMQRRDFEMVQPPARNRLAGFLF
ncbi:MAG: hypothetical protein L0H47_12020 [Micrococcaceae bacterium]|nr:hypothetical protein [Micrococcaceae bacterium]